MDGVDCGGRDGSNGCSQFCAGRGNDVRYKKLAPVKYARSSDDPEAFKFRA